MSIAAKQEELLEELALFQDWTERYEYVIGLGKKLPPLDETVTTPDWTSSMSTSGVSRHGSSSVGRRSSPVVACAWCSG